ncbi:hypothetical protein [Aquimarina brevivitae]|uniref:Phosphoribosylpyrophosphate synthetase n=1 Tax=Aquimarina brevivitae TaxID=323412 RepID=A0A4Q7PIG8_9FLAO|nr:hypothetical protein [Aquimarina brevivitae]RZT00038.1 hypothetical protein EV197_1268 [Aquimarina brevivitae]
MSTKPKKNERDYLDDYQDQGYTSSFRIKDESLVDVDSKKEYKPKDVKIVAEHRFEGMTNPSDLSILYVIETKDTKGTVLAAYGPNANLELAEFFKQIPEENISKK